MVSQFRVWLFQGRLPVAFLNYIKLVKTIYIQRIYHYLVQFFGMSHCWLQRYHERIRTLGSSLVVLKILLLDLQIDVILNTIPSLAWTYVSDLGSNEPIAVQNVYLSYDVASGSELTPCNKIDKPLVVYKCSRYVMYIVIALLTPCIRQTP